MTYRNLSEFAEDNDVVRQLLESDLGSVQTAREINDYTNEHLVSFSTTESSVRRWRAGVTEPGRVTNLESTYVISADKLRADMAIAVGPYTESAQPQTYRSLGRNSKVQTWPTGIEIGPDDGVINTVPRIVTPEDSAEPEDADVLREWELDPDVWEIASMRKSKWQRANGEWLEAFKIAVKRRSTGTGPIPPAEVESILDKYLAEQSTAPHSKAQRSSVSTRQMLMVPLGDLQIGKIDGGGTPAIIERFARLTADIEQRVQDEADGHLTALILPWLGDCIEGIVSQRGTLATRLDLSLTEQVQVYRRLLFHQIGQLSKYADKVLVPVVAGNHDETTRQWKTPVTDSWAIDGARAVDEALHFGRDDYAHVEFAYSDPEELTVTRDVGTDEHPLVLGFTHGHLFGGGPNGFRKWWSDQSHGRQQVGNADMLISAHFHHLRIEGTGGSKTWLQVPALDGGSDWFRRKSGEECPAGMVSVWLTPGKGSGWHGLTVHN